MSNSFGSPSPLSESSRWESSTKQPISYPSHANFSTRRSFMSKPVYPLVFPLVFRNPVSDNEIGEAVEPAVRSRLTLGENNTSPFWPERTSSLEHKFHRTLVIFMSSMIEGYGIHGLGLEALQIFHKMTDDGVKPNSVTFVSLLSACSHSGLVKEGREVFHYMREKCCIEPNLYHYTSLVDLLARSGKLQEAMTMIKDMTLAPDSRIWGSLLASCRVYSDCELGKYVAQRVFDLEPENAGFHVVLCNMQASIDKWGDAETVRKVMHVKNLKKKPAWSSLEVGGKFDTFVVGDTLHPQIIEIYEDFG